jgi:hypothetical protein
VELKGRNGRFEMVFGGCFGIFKSFGIGENAKQNNITQAL